MEQFRRIGFLDWDGNADVRLIGRLIGPALVTAVTRTWRKCGWFTTVTMAKRPDWRLLAVSKADDGLHYLRADVYEAVPMEVIESLPARLVSRLRKDRRWHEPLDVPTGRLQFT